MNNRNSEIALQAFYKSLYIGERRVRKNSAFSFFRGYKKFQTWKKLSGFINYPENFNARMAFEKYNSYEFCILLGNANVEPSLLTNIN